MKTRVVVLGAGFAGLELSTVLSDALGDDLDLTLIDKSDSFVFGFSKLDLMFGREKSEAVHLPYAKIAKRGVRFRQETIEAIDPTARKVTTNKGTYEADVLVVALGADYDLAATPGLVEGGNEFYTIEGAERVCDLLKHFSKGHVIVGVTSVPFKCPPAPSETALRLEDYLSARGVLGDCEISLVFPFHIPVPPSPETSRALIAAFSERGINFVLDRVVSSLDSTRKKAVLDDGSEMPYDLFLGVPKHRVPKVVEESGLIDEDGWIPVSQSDLKTRYPNVYAIGDVSSVEVPKAGMFAEGAARVAAASILSDLKRGSRPAEYDGAGSCYIEFGSHRVGKADMNFLSGPSPKGVFSEPSEALWHEKYRLAKERQERWFGSPN
jgi:sulfide:quinone oxidoreductase